MTLSKRIEREKRTVEVMINMFCEHNHETEKTPCDDCNELIEFANVRIDKCIFQDVKPVCSECQVHCYKKDMRDKIRKVMRFAGPRMLFKHPILGITHLIDKRRFKYVDPKEFKQKTP